MMKKVLLLVLVCVMLLTFAACGKTAAPVGQTTDPDGDEVKVTSIKIGSVASTEARLQLCQEILAQIGVDVEIVLFEGNAGPATGLKDGDVNAIIVNHLPWITAFNEANNTDLTMLQPYSYYCPTRMYSSKYDSVDEIPDGATICMPNDPTNLEIALLMLQSIGLIELGEKTDSYYSEADILSNSKNLNFMLMDTVYVVSSIDSADAIICFSVYAIKGDFDAAQYLYENPTDKENCPCGVIVRSEDKDAEWANYLARQLATDEWINRGIAIYGEGAHGYYN